MCYFKYCKSVFKSEDTITIMKKSISAISFILLACMLLIACSSRSNPDITTPAPPDTDHGAQNPEDNVKLLPKPYVDIEFTDSGSIFDAMGHVSCKLNDLSKGRVTNQSVPIDGKEYTFPHLSIFDPGGVAKLTYTSISTETELCDLLSEGFALETMVLNYNAFDSSSAEQTIAGTCHNGGYNLSCYKGAFTFSVHTGGAYSSAHNPGGVINGSMTHLIGVYDPGTQTAALYVNGEKVATVPASGTLGLATNDLWKQIILGGDISSNFSAHLYSYKTKIAVDLMLYWLKHRDIDTVMVVTKKQLVKNWENELAVHTHIKPKILQSIKCPICGKGRP